MWLRVLSFGIFALPITLIDLRELRVPDILSIGGIAVVSFLDAFLFHVSPGSIILQAGIGFGLFWAISVLTQGKLGLGDAKYSAFIALSVGLHAWLATLAVASIAGLAVALYLIKVHRAPRNMRIPFAPFLTLGAAVSFIMEHAAAG